MLFETARLILRTFEPEDAPFILELLNTPSWLTYIGDRKIRSLDDAKNYLVSGPLKSYTENGFGAWMVQLRETGMPIGMCGLLKRDFLGHPDVGFAFLAEYEGKGYGREALLATLDYCRKELQINELFAFTQKENARCLRLLERSGFLFKDWIQPSGEKNLLMLFAIDLNEQLHVLDAASPSGAN